MENKRKETRLKGFDYGTAGAYFLTVCTQGRKNILSTITKETLPSSELTSCGKILEKWISLLPQKFPEAKIDLYTIMPDHFHIILLVTPKEADQKPEHMLIERIMGWLKYQATKEINKNHATPGQRIFQRSFHDHIIRNREDYKETRKYIHENPTNWFLDKLYAKH